MAFAKTVMGGGTSAGQAAAIIGGGTAGLVAVGTTYADALQFPSLSAVQITTSSASTGCKLPSGVPGSMIAVENNSGQNILIYPPAGAQINALTVTTQGFTMADGKNALFFCISPTKWAVVYTA